MKVLGPILLLLLFALCSTAQTLPDQFSPLNVIQHGWRMDVRNHGLEKDPLESIGENEQLDRSRRPGERQNANRARAAVTTLPPPRSPVFAQEEPELESEPRGLSIAYVYEVTVSNPGSKRIRTIIWDYVFFEPDTPREVGRLRFASNVNIGPGKMKKVVVRTKSPPNETIDVTKTGQKARDQYSEQIVIQRLSYDDGSVWAAKSN